MQVKDSVTETVRKEGRKAPEFKPVVDMLARLARDRVYGPLDLLSRVEDNDDFYMRLAREALYSALRYLSTYGYADAELEEAVEVALKYIERRPYLAKELALRALAKAMSGEKPGSS